MYYKGDILIDFRRRILFEFPGMEGFDKKILYKCRLATPGETTIFKREFHGKKEISFEEFKQEMEVFDGRKMRNVIYAHIPLSESEYIFFRSMKHQFVYNLDFHQKLSVLIDSYVYPIEHNTQDEIEYAKLKELKRLLSELLTDEKK
ncbi:MAG: hypothetical protein NTW16_00835 [Bacteroidetes bacterium]|nr:hypothetical protein [Bacteroidota bacterium]